MITDIADITAERISEAVYSEMADVRSDIEDLVSGIQDAIDTLEAYVAAPDAEERIVDALQILKGLDR